MKIFTLWSHNQILEFNIIIIIHILSGKEETKGRDDREELDFHFDEEVMDIPAAKQNTFSQQVEEESDYELSDGEINKILIITPHRPKKHEG